MIQSGLVNSSFSERVSLDLSWGKILRVRLRHSIDESPVYVTAEIDVLSGVYNGKLDFVPIMRWSPRSEELPREGDKCIVGFIDGEIEGAVILGYLDTEDDPKNRTIEDQYYYMDEKGRTEKIDMSGTKITRSQQTTINMVVG